MVVISLANLKGGVGKSTIALNLAALWHSKGVRVLLYDSDTQGSIYKFFEMFGDNENLKGITCLRKEGGGEGQMKRVIEARSEDFDVMIVDTAPYISTDYGQLFKLSDLILMPIRTGGFDYFASEELHRFFKKFPKKKIRLVLNGLHQSNEYKKVFEQILHGGIAEFGNVEVLKSFLMSRIDYTRTPLGGETIMDSENKKAIEEMDALGNELLDILNE